jgi:hypothetical protein
MSSTAAKQSLQGMHTTLMHVISLFDKPESDLAVSTDGHIATIWKHDQGIQVPDVLVYQGSGHTSPV